MVIGVVPNRVRNHATSSGGITFTASLMKRRVVPQMMPSKMSRIHATFDIKPAVWVKDEYSGRLCRRLAA